jgi:RNA polymerase sigma-B factor
MTHGFVNRRGKCLEWSRGNGDTAVRRTRLSRAQAAALQRAYRSRGDLAARERLIEAYLPLAQSLARRFAHRGERVEDLVQVGTIGLIKAVDRFEPARGVDLAAFAAPTIVGEIKHHLRDRSTLIRTPRNTPENGPAPTPVALAENISAPGVEDTIAATESRVAVSIGMRALHRRERDAVRCRYFADMSQSEIGAALGISQTQASRLLASGLAKLRANLGPNTHFGAPSELHSGHGDSRRRQGRAA